MTDGLGRETRFTYDEKNRLVQTTFPDETGIGTTFGALDRPIRETDPSGAATHFAYDAVGNLTAVTDALHGSRRHPFSSIMGYQGRLG